MSSLNELFGSPDGSDMGPQLEAEMNRLFGSSKSKKAKAKSKPKSKSKQTSRFSRLFSVLGAGKKKKSSRSRSRSLLGAASRPKSRKSGKSGKSRRSRSLSLLGAAAYRPKSRKSGKSRHSRSMGTPKKSGVELNTDKILDALYEKYGVKKPAPSKQATPKKPEYRSWF